VRECREKKEKATRGLGRLESKVIGGAELVKPNKGAPESPPATKTAGKAGKKRKGNQA